jgi:ATP-binding cassette subfamily F protein uup
VKSAQKLSYKEQRELDGLPALIDALEKEQSEVRAALADSSLFAKDPAKAAAMFARDAQIDTELVKALERWEILSTP